MEHAFPLRTHAVLNHCRTMSGARQLRMNLLQPSSNLIQINTRLDMIDYLSSNGTMLSSLSNTLSRFNHLERMISQLVILNDKSAERTIKLTINNIMELHKLLRQIPMLHSILSKPKSTIRTL